ncbi:NADH-quinone oxidoreductase subunit M [Candidatus Persebacteraceae bacterium Df01]|jgi:NADH-quinone oxidoreductase subunit M|uniref:NADH-quinone oxidoreductase subunit M n=1 Tax=Candidatus Doriopsillibacter californiensis TaxID=2970740 RepID=A0ABT7QLR2_9GAMM|nr:NADH-quinone oxidoreductase subunit M [Candidatus Persebacteraceae bacterium Df01]
MSEGLLSLLIWLPIIGGVGLLALPLLNPCPHRAKMYALIISVVAFLLSLPLFFGFDNTTAAMQFVEDVPWIDRYGIRYGLGVDGLSVLMILLNTFTTLLVVAAGWEVIKERVAAYMGAFLIMSGFTNGVFAATDSVLFYMFWEATLIPLFIVIGVWGGERRVYAALKFFLYTLLGSLLMLAAILYLFNQADSFSIAAFHEVPLSMTAQTLLFFAFLAAFAVKVPMTPVHTWLPDAHVEAPTGGSIVLAAVMLKLGAYGFLRFSLPIAPDASVEYAWLMIALSLIAIVYIGLVALVQEDMKKLIAYSSIAHMGFVTLGFFLFDEWGIVGGIAQMVSHGFISGAMFFCVGVLYDRLHTRRIADYGGVVNAMPKYSAFLMLFAMANAGLPGTSGFVGEFIVILAAINANFWVGLAAAFTLITGAAYSLWMYKRVIFGAVVNDQVSNLQDVSRRELIILIAFAALVLLMGLWPLPFLDVVSVSAEHLLEHVERGKL